MGSSRLGGKDWTLIVVMGLLAVALRVVYVYYNQDEMLDKDQMGTASRLAASIANDKAISLWGFELFLELLRSYHGPNLLRVKGIVKLDDDEAQLDDEDSKDDGDSKDDEAEDDEEQRDPERTARPSRASTHSHRRPRSGPPRRGAAPE